MSILRPFPESRRSRARRLITKLESLAADFDERAAAAAFDDRDFKAADDYRARATAYDHAANLARNILAP